MLTQEDKMNVVIKENHDWKEDYITIPQKLKLQKSRGKSKRKTNNKQIFRQAISLH